jgi:hypothetical protein
MFPHQTSTLYTPFTAITTPYTQGIFARIFLAVSEMPNRAHDTPKTSRIKGAADYMKYKGIPFYHSDLFRYNGVSKTRGWAIIQQDNELFDRRHHNNEILEQKEVAHLFFHPRISSALTDFFKTKDGPHAL